MDSTSPCQNVNVDAAVRECLEECAAADQPELCLAVYLLTLRADPSWPEEDIDQVERTVREMLRSAPG